MNETQYKAWVVTRLHKIEEMGYEVTRAEKHYICTEGRLYTVKCTCGHKVSETNGAKAVIQMAAHLEGGN